MKRTIVLVGTNTTGTGAQLMKAACRRGLAVVLLSADPTLHGWASGLGARIEKTDTSDFEAVLEACRRVAQHAEVVAVTSTADRLTATAARAAQTLGLPGPDPEALHVAADKQSQREIFHRLGVPSPQWCIAHDSEAAVAAVCSLGQRVVIKPVRGSGSVGTRLVVGAAEAACHAWRLSSGELTGRQEHILLIEEYVEGDQYSIESFHGSVIGVTRNLIGALPSFVEIGHDFPAPLDPAGHAAVSEVAAAAIGALGISWGAAHVEVRVGPRGPVVIEVNARLAGGMIPELIRMARGVDLVDAMLSLCLGEMPSIDPVHDRAASLRAVLAPQHGRLLSVAAPAKLPRGVAWVQARNPGDVVGGFGDFRDRVGYVLAEGLTVDQSAPIAEQWARQVRLALARDGEGSTQ